MTTPSPAPDVAGADAVDHDSASSRDADGEPESKAKGEPEPALLARTYHQLRAWAVANLNRWDALVVLAILGVVRRAVQVRYPPSVPFLTPETDSAMLCTFASGFDHPGRYAGDAILGDTSNYDFYATVQVPWTRMMEGVFGDYGIALYAAMPMLVFFQLLGFYTLGRALYDHRLAAALLSASCLFQIKIRTLSTYWGISTWTTARDWFQAFLPFVLALALTSRHRPRRFIGVMVGAGLLIYLHPVSTPGWALAMWCGLWLCLPTEWSFWRRFRWMFLCGLVFLATAAPFVIKYLTAHESGGGVANIDAVRKIILFRFLPDYSNPANATLKIVRQLLGTGLPFMALMGGLVAHRLGADAQQKRGQILLWTLLIVVFAFAIPIYEHAWAYENGRIPFEYDLIRNCRYLYMVCYLLGLWPLALATERRSQITAAAFAAVFLGVQLLSFRTPALDLYENSIAARFNDEKIPPPYRPDQERVPRPKKQQSYVGHDQRAEAMLWIRDNLPEDVTFVGHHAHDCLYLRYVARRSVKHCWKDGGVLIYSSFDKLQHWYRWAGRMRNLGKQDASRAFPGLVGASRQLGASHIFMRGRVPANVRDQFGAEELFMNERYSVYAIPPE